MTTDEALVRVARERDRQDDKWGPQNHSPHKWMTILMEEVGEAAKEIYELEVDRHKHPAIYASRMANAVQELSEVAAVAVATMESLERRQWEW